MQFPLSSRLNLKVSLCNTSDIKPALELLYHRVPEPARSALVISALGESQSKCLDLSGLWVAYNGALLTGVMLTQELSGGAAALWAPEIKARWRRSAVADALLNAGLVHFRERQVQIVQALLDESSPAHSSSDLTRNGLVRVTDLTYMSRGTAEPLEVDACAPQLRWHQFTAELEPEFQRILEATYIQSLDMPELEGTRSLRDILATHKAGGRFNPERWQIGRVQDEPNTAAILLLTEAADREAWEVAYLGLTPAARGRGLGQATLMYALSLAHVHVSRLQLAVDVRNQPAEKLYLRAGFTPHDRRAVYVRLLSQWKD
jgi:ribosomal protein S18 acetylase RimI-like enzyme